MADPLAGLLNSERLTNQTNYRAKIFHKFPTGSAELTGLLSLTDGEEASNSSTFAWFEDMHPDYRTTTANVSGNIVFRNTTDPWGVASGNVSAEVDESFAINVTNRSYFREGSVFRFSAYNTDAELVEITAIVTSLPSSVSTAVVARIIASDDSDYTDLDYDSASNAGLTVYHVTDAHAEKHTSAGDGYYREPGEFSNYIQCLEYSFSATEASKAHAQEYDRTGVTAEQMWQGGLKHSIDIEQMLFWGEKHKYTDSSDNSNPTFTSGGIRWFLRQYEAANSEYRGGTGAAALTSDGDELKRIIANSGGTITVDKFEQWMELVSREINVAGNSRVAFLGGVAARNIQKLFRTETTYNVDSNDGELSKWGVNYKGVETATSDLWFKTHPLFRRDAALQKQMWIVNLPALKLRYLNGLNTKFVEHAENNADSFQKSLWRSYLGLELHGPEGFMIVEDISSTA